MNDELVQSILAFTLRSRKALEAEAGDLLEGCYGWIPDGSFRLSAGYPALSLPEAAETRRLLEAYVAEEAEAGLDTAAAREKLMRETAFTWLNRAVAFRMMEERGILKATLGRLHKSNAFIYWLTDVKGEASIPASTPVDALGEGPVDAAYREFLLWQCGELAAEVSVLFDPATLASRLCPRPAMLKELVESMNAADLAEAWQAGNEETIGWVYQGFSAEELEAAFAAARTDKKKFEPEDIPAVTQLFTIRWVVRFLVENTLGRIWVEMHPDSRLAKSLGYYVPPKHPQQRAVRPIRDITLLDPCCGSMHFGLLGFDLFADMYREERENAGKPGWPETPSAATEEEIPELILAHNLHGIDIDTRAVQLSALTLVLKARMLNPKAAVTDRNLASANIEQITGGQLDAFIDRTEFSHPIYERILRRLADRVKDSPHLGSLLRLEKDIQQLVEAERKRSGELLDQLPGMHPEQFDTEEGVEEFFDILTDQILRHLDHFVQSTRAEGQHAGLFAREAAKGLRFLSLIDQRYDVVTTNPPYLSGGKMNKRLSTLMEQEYKEGKGDLYAAFILRCQELLATEGLMGMLTMHSFMFISGYEGLRARLRKEVAIETLAHFGGGLFAVGNPGTLQTAAFVLRREPEAAKREGQVGTYFRLVKERDADAKRVAFESALATLSQGDDHPQLFHYQQSGFDGIPRSPWVYWVSAEELAVFSACSPLGEQFEIDMGLKTSGNVRFVRFWWEVGRTKIELSQRIPECRASTKKWFRYAKGGKGIASKDILHVVNWETCGADLKAYLLDRYPYLNGNVAWCTHNEELYYHPAITWSSVSSRGLQIKPIPPGVICSNANYAIFPKPDEVGALFAFLSSDIAKYFSKLLCPTINHNKGDVALLPIPEIGNSAIFAESGRALLEKAARENTGAEVSLTFVTPQIGNGGDLATEEDLDGVNSEAFAITQMGKRGEIVEDVISSNVSSDEHESEEESGDDEDDEVTGDLRPADWARSWVSYAFGTVLGRFEIGKPGGLGCGDFPEATVAEIRQLIDPDGIMPCEEGHQQDIAARAFACLELMLGAAEARERVRLATDTEGDPVEALRGWLDRFTGTPAASFWKYHHQLYRKRPVYWPLQSPRRKYTIWVFQAKFDKNTLFTVRNLVEERLRLLDREIADKRAAAGNNRRLAKEVDKLLDVAADLREASKRIKEITDRGYTPHIDDGVLLNAAPLHPLLPSWPETKKVWAELEDQQYEWAQQAMEHWPDRVREACKHNKSFAIAHGLVE